MSARQIPHADDSGTRSSADDADMWLVQHGDALYQYARSRVGNREVAEDLVQDALLAALQSRDQFQSRATIRTWLVSILRHKIVDFYRREDAIRARRKSRFNWETGCGDPTVFRE